MRKDKKKRHNEPRIVFEGFSPKLEKALKEKLAKTVADKGKP